jgi:hypothetical protein
MGALYGFLAGAAVGAGATVIMALTWQRQSGASLADGVAPGGASLVRLDAQLKTLRMQRDAFEERLQAREAEVARLTQELAAARAATPAAAPPAVTTPAPPAPGAPPAPPAGEAVDARREWRAFVSSLQLTAAPLRRAEATPAERGNALAALLAGLADADPRRAAAAAETIAAVADHLTPDELAKVEAAFRDAPTGTPARAGLAAAVARGLARDPRLAAFLESLPPVEEPRIRELVLRQLDRDPSAAYRAWAVKLSATEQDPDVLDELWDEDRVIAALTRESAAPLREAVEPRLAGTAIADPQLRGRAYLAIALSAVYDPEGATASLERLLRAETNPKVQGVGAALLAAVRGSDANLVNLIRLWKERRGELRD